MKVWHLNHSGVAVETENHLLFFDIFGEALTPAENEGLEKGVINPAQMQYKDILFFVSHEHHDHFDPKIFGLDKMGKRVRYVLPEEFDEIFEDGIFVHANMQVQLEDCRITTFDSTDIGVAYLVEIDGMRIYHAGDLNWWHWENDSKETQKDEEFQFKEEIDKIKRIHNHIDLVFIPVDPRLGQGFSLAGEWLIKEFTPKVLVPMHFGDKFHTSKDLINKTGDIKTEIVDIREEGQVFELEI